ncbi:TolC family protein [Echinicola shivajiensis]|uniref:TolC family protein n=1 Tax=Echinicola shivajiensis TaxID=1035916 RepID=UPI001BFC4A0F|nr:TolC family protein [Echinicola shivajiensis]
MKRRYLLILLSLIFQPIWAQNTQMLTIQECLELALQNNKRLKLQKLELNKEQQKLKAEANFLQPEISAFSQYFLYLDDYPVYFFPENTGANLNGPVQLGADQNFYSGIMLEQSLLDARMFGAGKLKQASGEIFERKIQLDENELRYEVLKAYFQVLSLQENQVLLDFNKERLHKLKQITSISVDNKFAKSVDLEEIELRQKELVIRERKFQQGYEQSLKYLKLLCGLPQDQKIALVNIQKLETEFVPLETMDSIKGISWELMELQKQINSSASAKGDSQSYPSLDLFMSFQWLQQEGYGDLFSSNAEWFNQHIIGLRLNIPIISKGTINRKEQAKLDNEILNLQQELLLESQQMQREKALDASEIARVEMEHHEELLDLRKRQYGQAELRYKEHTASLRELLETDEELVKQKVAFQQKKVDYFLSILDLYKAYDILDHITDLP